MEELKLMASDETLNTVLDAIKKHLQANNTPDELMIPIMVAVEEIYVNIAHYAYGGAPGEARVAMEVTPNPKTCTVTFRDKGIPYNPLAKADPDLDADVMDRQIGGLGIFMAKEMMDRMDYAYENGENVLTIEKSL